MNYQPIITDKVMIFDFKKPIYGSYYSIYEKWLNIAKRKHLKIVARSEFGTATYESYRDWLKGAEKIKKFHNFDDCPMIMYGKHILPDIKMREKRKKAERKKDQDYTNKGAKTVLSAWKDVINSKKKNEKDI